MFWKLLLRSLLAAALLVWPVAAGARTFQVLAFGDSITQGGKITADGTRYGILTPPNGARTTDGYEPELEYDFATQTTHSAYVYNWGWGGEDTVAGVNRIDTVLDSREGDFILIMEGTNDLVHSISSTTTQTNLRIMIDKSRAKRTAPVIATIPPNTSTQYNGDLVSTHYNPAIRSLALEKGIPLADQYAALNSRWADYTSGDGIHLNDLGEKVMAQTWLNTLMGAGKLDPVLTPILQLLLE